MSAEAGLAIGAGFAEIRIVDPVPMSGFAARSLPSTGTADVAPRVSALALGDELLVVVDAIGVDPALVQAVAAATGHPSAFVAATHTHAGPCVLSRGLGARSEAAVAAIAEAAALAVDDARSARLSCTVEWLRPEVPGVAVNRRIGQPAGQAQLKGFRWLDASGRIRGTFVNYPCHPVTLGPNNLELSGDYPGFLRAAVEARSPGVCVFTTGCAGDINTGSPATASYSLAGSVTGRTMADSRAVGERLAGAVLDGEWSPLGLTHGVRAGRTPLSLAQEPRDDVSLPELQARWRAEKVGADPGVVTLLDSWIRWADAPGSGQAATWDGEVAAIGLGDLNIVLLPGEPFLAAAGWIEERVGAPTIAMGYAGDVPGYLPARADYPAEGYEVIDAHRYYGQPAPFAPGSLEATVDAACLLVERLRRQP